MVCLAAQNPLECLTDMTSSNTTLTLLLVLWVLGVALSSSTLLELHPDVI